MALPFIGDQLIPGFLREDVVNFRNCPPCADFSSADVRAAFVGDPAARTFR